jgi:hypothetical protein
MRKVIAILLTCYILLLVVAPCVDKDICVGGNDHPSLIPSGLPFHQDQLDCCTPFCSCSCCGIPIEVMKAFIISRDYSVLTTLTFLYNPRLHSHCDFSIWEPPKA